MELYAMSAGMVFPKLVRVRTIQKKLERIAERLERQPDRRTHG